MLPRTFKPQFLDQLSWGQRVLHRILCALFQYRDIVKKELRYPPDGPGVLIEHLYLRRWFLFMDNERAPNFRLFLHHILLSDDDRDPHDHPWDFSSVILKGQYLEHIRKHPGTPQEYDTSSLRTRWRLAFREAEHTHQVKLVDHKSCWTLVRAYRARRIWGFWISKVFTPFDESGWQSWKTYLELPLDTPEHPEDKIVP